jgi:hypothetical protein
MDRTLYPHDFTTDGKIIPDRQDYDAIDREFGTNKSPAELYRLAQARKLIRLFGWPPT